MTYTGVWNTSLAHKTRANPPNLALLGLQLHGAQSQSLLLMAYLFSKFTLTWFFYNFLEIQLIRTVSWSLGSTIKHFWEYILQIAKIPKLAILSDSHWRGCISLFLFDPFNFWIRREVCSSSSSIFSLASQAKRLIIEMVFLSLNSAIHSHTLGGKQKQMWWQQ